MGILAQPIIVEQCAVAVKSESAYSTPATIAATDFLYVSKFVPKFDHKSIERNQMKGNLLASADVPGNTLVDIEIEGDYQTAGAAGSVFAAIDALEKACGRTSTTSAGVSVAYTTPPTGSAGFPCPGTSLTCVGYFKGELVTVRGVYGTMVETLKSDGVVTFAFKGKGLYTPMSHSTVPSTTYQDKYVQVISASVSAHGYDPEVSQIVVDYGVSVVADPYVGDAYGYSRTRISGEIKPTVKIDPLMDSVATFDPISKMITKASGSITVSVGSVAGSRISYSFPTTQFREVNVADRNGAQAWDITANVFGQWTKTIS